MSKTIVMIHGAFAGAWSFENFVDVFRSRGWTCHAPDLRFHGVIPNSDQEPHLARTSIEDYTDDMVAFIAGLDDAPIIIGHSMGGLVAQQLAAKGLARGLVLLTAGAPWGILPSTSDEMAVAIGLMTTGPFWTKSIQPVFEVAAENALEKLDPNSRRQVFDKLGPESGRALFELFFWMFDVRHAIAVDSTKIKCPVLVVSGSDDKVISASTGRRVAQLYGSNATYHEAQGHGHFLLLEPGWESVAERCADWILQHGASS